MPLQIAKPSVWNIHANQSQVQNYVDKVLASPIDVALLGLGPNGHVGFHEPGLPADFRGGQVTVSDETKNRIAGIVTNQALTFGVAAFLQAKEIMMIVGGEQKRKILNDLQTSQGSELLPASLLKSHGAFTIFTDLK